ncbi:hypothetical protein D3C86_1676450 [compost metagenome]
MAAVGVLFRQVAVFDPVMQFLAPGQVGLQITLVQRILVPGRIDETAVATLGLQLGLAKQDVLQFHAEMRDVFGAVQRLPDGLGEHRACRRQQVLALDADDRIQAEGVL